MFHWSGSHRYSQPLFLQMIIIIIRRRSLYILAKKKLRTTWHKSQIHVYENFGNKHGTNTSTYVHFPSLWTWFGSPCTCITWQYQCVMRGLKVIEITVLSHYRERYRIWFWIILGNIWKTAYLLGSTLQLKNPVELLVYWNVVNQKELLDVISMSVIVWYPAYENDFIWRE